MRIRSFLRKVKYHIWYYNHHTKRFNTLNLPKLSSKEKSLVRKTWPGVTILPIDWVSARAYKKVNGFSPYYLAPCWYNEIRDKTNPKNQLCSLENKALFDIYFPELSFPETYVRCMNGLFFDNNMNNISRDRAIDILREKSSFIIKPSIGSNQGKGVKRINDSSRVNLNDVITGLIPNFIAQEVIKQAPEIAQFNPSSLNCFRVTTIYLNGKFGYVTALKIGKKGEFKDNWVSGYWVKVNSDGRLCEYGYDYLLNKVDQSDCGVKFSNVKMPLYLEMVQFLEKMHKKLFPNCGVIGWDVTIDNNYCIRIIEVNLTNPGTNIEQFVSGDFFKSFRDDMLSYFNK